MDGSGITATTQNGPTYSADGIYFDGSYDYMSVTTWSFGGSLTFEVYLKQGLSNSAKDAVFQFSDENQGSCAQYTSYFNCKGWTAYHCIVLIIA